MIEAHDSRLGALRMRHERALHLGRADAVAGDIDHVVDAPSDPVVAILVAPCAVAAKVVPREGGEVRGFISRVIAEERAHHARPRRFDAQQPLARPLKLVALFIEDDGLHAEERERRGARLLRPRSRERRDHVPRRLRLPPRVHNRALAITHHVVIPLPRLRIDGLADSPEHFEALARVLGDKVVAGALKRADRRRRSVKLGHLVLVDDFPAASRVRVVGNALEDDLRGAVQHRAVRQIAVSGDPSAVRRAPVDVAVVVVEDVLEGGGGVEHVPAGCVEHAFRLAGGAGGVEDEEWILGVHPLHRALGGHRGDGVLPPHVAALHERALLLFHRALVVVQEHRLRREAFALADDDGVVHDLLEADRLGAAHHRGGGEHHLRLGRRDALPERLRGEAAKHHGVHSADARARQHRQRQLVDHRQVDNHAVPLFDADRLEVVGELGHLILRLRERQLAIFAHRVALPQQRIMIALPSINPSVQAVVSEVRGPALEPLHSDSPLVHVHVGGQHRFGIPLLLPVKLRGDVRPESRRVLDRALVHFVILLS
mmetsp:Transcript_17377/g.56878  ORF Transcript_17377/g.56878 Transcript_17377/m.56878 type:complete len:544 (-) Transcript_17377:204-1835(-)